MLATADSNVEDVAVVEDDDNHSGLATGLVDTPEAGESEGSRRVKLIDEDAEGAVAFPELDVVGRLQASSRMLNGNDFCPAD